MNNPVDRKVILIERQRAVEVGWLMETGTTTLSVRGLRGAQRAQRGRQARKIPDARWTEQFALAVCSTQQAACRECRVQDLLAEAFEAVGLG